jgi:hypothetical protein
VPRVCRLLTLVASLLAAADSPAYARFTWLTANPKAQGMSTSKLDILRSGLQSHNTSQLLVVRERSNRL